MPTVAIFAGSKVPADPEIMKAATQLGRKLAEAGYAITYGGGAGGVMGAVARAALAAGGKVTAVVLDAYKDEEQFPGADVIAVRTEQDRFRFSPPTATRSPCSPCRAAQAACARCFRGWKKPSTKTAPM